MSLRRGRFAALALVAAVTAPLLAGCTTVHLHAAPRANTVACADVTVNLPTSLESKTMRETDAQGTSAWGSPTAILLTCGITTPKVSDLACYAVDGVDWLVDTSNNSRWVYTTYGRTPGVQIVVDTKSVAAPTNVLFDVSTAVGSLPQNGACEGVSDTTPTATPTP